jgi:hypothetical protein
LKGSELLQHLDAIERRNPALTVDEGALDLIEAFGQTFEDVQVLINRYASSQSVNITNYLAFFLARRAVSPSPEFAPLIFSFIEKLETKEQAETLISCLSAIQSQLVNSCLWEQLPQPPASLYPFLHHCLSISGPNATLVQFCALQVILTFHEKGELEKAFSSTQIRELQKIMLQLAEQNDDLLQSELEGLADFLHTA